MRRPYLEEMKRLAEIEKQVSPARMVTVELPDGTEKELKPLEFWAQRGQFIDTNEKGVTTIRARVEGLSPELFSLLLMESETIDLKDGNEKRAMFNFLSLFFGRSTAQQIIESEGGKTK